MLRALAADRENFVLVETGSNLGFARGCNIGAQRASGDVVLFLNPDTISNDGALEHCVRRALAEDFGWGDVTIRGVGEGKEVIKFIGSPIEFRNHITTQ